MQIRNTVLFITRLLVLSATAFSISACSGGGGDGGGGDGSSGSTGGGVSNGATGGENGGVAAPVSPSLAASSASVSKILEVPASLKQAPFDTPKKLTVPPGFGIKLWARIEGARFMALAPNGDVLVSHPGSGKVFLLRDDGASEVPQRFEFATGLQKPHDIVFHTIDNVTYVYIAEVDRITRSVYNSGDTKSAAREILIDNLPNASTAELKGTYSHELKNIALSPDHKLYVSIASSCNVCTEDVTSSPVRGAIYQYNADGSGQRLFARGIRNAEGLDFIPGTNDLWVTINNRDNIRYPFNNDFDGNGSNDLGKSIQKFTDTNPPDLFTRVRDGGNYGWPYCNASPNSNMSKLELVPDYDLNRDGRILDCATVDRSSKGIRAHSAPLGLSFLHNTNVPPAYRQGAITALHGCWNCSRLDSGYKVVFFPFDSAGNAGMEIDLVSGFVTDPDGRSQWGRPVDAIADARGNFLISDDYAGAIYQLYPL